MAVCLASLFSSRSSDLRYQPTPKRVRVRVAGVPVADTTRAVLVWEPHRVVPQYAVPIEDVYVQLVPAPSGDDVTSGGVDKHEADGPTVLTPATGFSVHTSDGDVFTVRTVEHEYPGAAFQPHDPDLAGYVVLEFAAFDEWLEEDEPILGHPHDPFKRIDIRQSSRTVRIERDGVVLGIASYWSLPGVADDIAWSYPLPLPEAAPITGMLCFFDERVDVILG